MNTQQPRTAKLLRRPSTPDGTPGQYVSDSGLTLATIERPWLDNKSNVSCPPAGKYLALWQWSNKHSCNLYHLQGVPNRTNIEIHSANVYQQLLGCLAPGSAISAFTRDSIRPGCPDRDLAVGVTNSKEALAKLEADMCEEDAQVPFWLEIVDA